jgi:hypothetical protein
VPVINEVIAVTQRAPPSVCCVLSVCALTINASTSQSSRITGMSSHVISYVEVRRRLHFGACLGAESPVIGR